MLWLLTAGAADCSAQSLANLSAAASNKKVSVCALSLFGIPLGSLGIPRWFSCHLQGLPKLLTRIFSDATNSEAQVDASTASERELACHEPHLLAVEDELPPLMSDGLLVAFRAARSAVRGPLVLAGLPHLTYLSAALDYTIDGDKEGRSQSSHPPTIEAISKEEIAAFYHKVSSSAEEVQSYSNHIAIT